MTKFDLSRILERFKRKWTSELDPSAIEGVCREEGLEWRRRILDPVRTIQLFFVQVLHGNTACAHLPHLSQLKFSASAYCQARARLPLRVFETLLERLGAGIQKQESEEGRWRGHRTLFVDGSSFSMPDTQNLQEYFGQPPKQSKGCGFPTSHILTLFHAGTGMVLRILSSPLCTHDMTRAAELHPELLPGDVLVADRAFCSFGHMCRLLQRQVHCVMRVHQRKIVNFRAGRSYATHANHKKGKPTSKWLKKLGPRDQLVQWVKPKSCNRWITPEQFSALPEFIVVRELYYQLTKPGFRTTTVTLVTTLLSAQDYPADALAQLYGRRWSIEINFRHLKTTMGMDVLRCETVDGVMKELCIFCIVYNLVRLVMLEAAKQHNLPIDRISFIDALRWLTQTLNHPLEFQITVNPCRPNRIEPRAIKRRQKTFSLLKIPRQQARSSLKYQ